MRTARAAVLGVLLAASSAAQAEDAVRESVIKIFTISQRPDYYQPWQNTPEESSSGSGVVIAGDRILTNAHVVSDAIFVQVRRSGDEKKYDATVEFVAHDTDLALLKVKDRAFFAGIKPVPVGELAHQRDKVTIYGFPIGGDELSINEGTVSRVEVVSYAQSGLRLLALQTDGAINPGNSGGPMIRDGKIVGIAFQSLTAAENIGYGVPAPLIKRFLKDVADGHYDGVPLPGMAWQTLESDDLRRFLKMKPGQTGIRVARTIYGCPGAEELRQGDVLTAINGVKISNDATYPIGKDKRILFTHLVAEAQAGDKVPFDVLRDGVPMKVSVPMKTCETSLVPGPFYGVRPRYFIYGGLVFTPLTSNWMSTWSQSDQAVEFRYLQESVEPTRERQEAVVLAYVLPHEVNEGYHDLRGWVIESVNGRKIGKLQDLVDAFSAPRDGYQVIRFDTITNGSEIILDAAKASAAGPEILATHRIPKDRSEDLPR